MLIAGSVDLDEVLVQLAATRPVFHSEADFQLAFAWLVQQYTLGCVCDWRRGQRLACISTSTSPGLTSVG